ncbi:DJ-1 family glyoxalase III [Alkalibacter saccharofermentans]|uniref:4-methyl-5(B-hydroxyethyl)-thiazole monophosphate biosynthesis n=1 Tax=Alkalibacter saccharofermentans DSM 14828 TaxID=1120975 RepID=A0A1M4S9Z8_9FIRM|nr:DJ-1 family glyoxalase III [Alkalibacter saccharofermentans]SHE28988.1 4-methyl-5(b-hydroxyethyl)-thiazole monophosphate biosynthesis [Alkalibacter saccharofermentans DSM 14828]
MKAAIFLAEGFEEIEALATVDVLRRGGISVKTVSVTEKFDVEGAHGITVLADILFEDTDFHGVDILILPGGMPGTRNLEKHKGLIELIKKFHNDKKWIAAICAAPKILGKLGLLKGQIATCYPGFEKDLEGAILSDESVVLSSNLITSRGAGTAVLFGLKLVEVLKNKETADELKEKMIVV